MTKTTGARRTPQPMTSLVEGMREDADIGTSSDEYARRFTGEVGRWFVETQKRLTLELLRSLPPGSTVLDVGGGHAQIAPALLDNGFEVTVVGSDPICASRLSPLLEAGRCRFQAADLQNLPYSDRSFDVVVCLRLLPHSVWWTGLIRELCRVARRSVLLDYPSLRSVNILAGRLFKLKKGIELNTRGFIMFTPSEIDAAFRDCGYEVQAERPQYLLPMVLHRWLDVAPLSKLAEVPGRYLGLTRWFGSPIIARADRTTAQP
jgi:SAM-dependent methyltransferase